jgi:hypothetical protein
MSGAGRDNRRNKLDETIRAATQAGGSLRAVAEVAGLSVEWTRRIARKGGTKRR